LFEEGTVIGRKDSGIVVAGHGVEPGVSSFVGAAAEEGNPGVGIVVAAVVGIVAVAGEDILEEGIVVVVVVGEGSLVAVGEGNLGEDIPVVAEAVVADTAVVAVVAVAEEGILEEDIPVVAVEEGSLAVVVEGCCSCCRR
jgi:hypothetical protein